MRKTVADRTLSIFHNQKGEGILDLLQYHCRWLPIAAQLNKRPMRRQKSHQEGLCKYNKNDAQYWQRKSEQISLTG